MGEKKSPVSTNVVIRILLFCLLSGSTKAHGTAHGMSSYSEEQFRSGNANLFNEAGVHDDSLHGAGIRRSGHVEVPPVHTPVSHRHPDLPHSTHEHRVNQGGHFDTTTETFTRDSGLGVAATGHAGQEAGTYRPAPVPVNRDVHVNPGIPVNHGAMLNQGLPVNQGVPVNHGSVLRNQDVRSSQIASEGQVVWRNGMISQIGGRCPGGSVPAHRQDWCLIHDRGAVKQYLTSEYGADVSGMTHSSGSLRVQVPTGPTGPTEKHIHGTAGTGVIGVKHGNIDQELTIKGEKINVEVKGRRVTMIRGECPGGSAPSTAVHGWCDIHEPSAVQAWFQHKYGLKVDLSAALGGTIDIRVIGNMISRIKGHCPPGTFPATVKPGFCVMSDRNVIQGWLQKTYGINLNINHAVEKSATSDQLNIEIEGDSITRVYNVCPQGSQKGRRPGWCHVHDWTQVQHWLATNYGVKIDMTRVKPIHKSFEVINGLIDPIYGHCPGGTVRAQHKCRVVNEAHLRQGIVEILNRYQKARPLSKRMTIHLPARRGPLTRPIH